MLKSVPMGQSVDVVVRRGYPMLYNPDGCPKNPQQLTTPPDPGFAHVPGAAQSQNHPSEARRHQIGRLSMNRSQSQHNGIYPRAQGGGSPLDANGNATGYGVAPPLYSLINEPFGGAPRPAARGRCAPPTT